MKKLRLELLDNCGKVVVTHTLDYDENRGNKMRLIIDDNRYFMNTSGKLVILTQQEIDEEQRIINAKELQTKLKFF